MVNWAWQQGWTVRARGCSHGWSPLTIPEGTEADAPVLLVDTVPDLTGLSLESTAPAAVRAGAGVTLETLLGFLEDHGLGLTATPAPGDLTLGGALAIDAHGTAVPADGESRLPGHTYGSLSNLVLSLTAVVWDADSDAYVLRTYDRDDADGAALLTHLGRALVTEVVLRAGANTNLRCVSRTDIPAAELFAAPGGDSGGRTFASFLDESGRAEAIWFAFTEFPWLKVWSVAPTKPLDLATGDVAVQLPLLGQRPHGRGRPRRTDRVRRGLVSGSGPGQRAVHRGRPGADRHAVRGHLGAVQEHAALHQAHHPAGDRQRLRRAHLAGRSAACRRGVHRLLPGTADRVRRPGTLSPSTVRSRSG